MILDEISKKEDDVFDLHSYMNTIQRNLLKLCFVYNEHPEEVEKCIGKFSIIGKNQYRRKTVVNAIEESCKYFKIKDFDEFYNMKCIPEKDIIKRIEKLCDETIDGKLSWKKQDKDSLKTNDVEFYIKGRSLLTIDRWRMSDSYSLTFKGKAKAAGSPVTSIYADKGILYEKMKVLFELASSQEKTML